MLQKNKYPIQQSEVNLVRFRSRQCNSQLINRNLVINNIFRAVRHGCLGTVKFFVEAGARIDSKNLDGSTPLHLAAQYGYLNIVKYLLKKRSHLEIKDKIIGNTPLHLAILYDHFDIVKYLFESGADLNAINKWGDTPLSCAAKSGYLKIVK
ncbi:MAG: ankyrin repeat domain-containing protein, partial [Candidatus Rickettsiella isopodorum]